MAHERDPIDMISELILKDDRLSIWELDFIENINGNNLSEKQLEKLTDIYEKYCS